MLFYNRSKYLCPCGDTAANTNKNLPLVLKPRSLHSLPDLFFCPKCHEPKCSNCCNVAIVCKYCANCMSDYTDSPGMTRCSKNCFECPECVSPLSVSIHDEAHPKKPGKQFRFTCVYCSYAYATKTVAKPAPLSTILKNELSSYFQHLHEMHTVAHKLLLAQESSNQTQDQKLSKSVLAKMKQMDIDPSVSNELSETKKLELRLDEFSPQPVDIDADFVCKKRVSVPKGAHLTAKSRHSCSACGTCLLSPVADARLMKYLEKELAPEVMPLVTAKVCPMPESDMDPHIFAVGSDTPCVLNIVNSMLFSVNVTVSSLEQIPSEVSEAPYKVSVSLPIVSITVPARREKANVLDSIPSVYLTCTTLAARAEMLTRSIRRETARRKTEPDEPYVEQGLNWVSLPFTLSVLEKLEGVLNGENDTAALAPTQLKLPFYITVETRLPSQWTVRSKKGLKYGFWVVCDTS